MEQEADSVCVSDGRKCTGDPHGAAWKRSVKLEWTPGPRLALIAFPSCFSYCIRVTFPLWGGIVSLLYIYLFYFLSLLKCTISIQAVTSQRWRFKTAKRLLQGSGSHREPRKLSPTISSAYRHIPTNTHKHLWLCFASRRCIMKNPLFVRLFHYLPSPFFHPMAGSNAIYHLRGTLCLIEREKPMNK